MLLTLPQSLPRRPPLSWDPVVKNVERVGELENFLNVDFEDEVALICWRSRGVTGSGRKRQSSFGKVVAKIRRCALEEVDSDH